MSYFETRGFAQDKAAFFRYLARIAEALEKLTEADEDPERDGLGGPVRPSQEDLA